jgi:hypothetical protein
MIQPTLNVGNVYRHYKTNVKYIIKSIHRYGSKESECIPIACYYALEEDNAEVFYRFVPDFNEIVRDRYENIVCRYRFLYNINDEEDNSKINVLVKEGPLVINPEHIKQFIENNRDAIIYLKIKNQQPRRN